MTTLRNSKNIIMYIGNSNEFPRDGWIHNCYFCEAPTGERVKFLGKYEVYECKNCRKRSWINGRKKR